MRATIDEQFPSTACDVARPLRYQRFAGGGTVMGRVTALIAVTRLLIAVTGFAALGCGGLSDSLRAQAAGDLSCDESRLTSENLGPRTVRIVGCGKSALYACKQAALSPEPRAAQVTEAEARFGTASGEGPCAWTRVP